jgi:hypothetical protein
MVHVKRDRMHQSSPLVHCPWGPWHAPVLLPVPLLRGWAALELVQVGGAATTTCYTTSSRGLCGGGPTATTSAAGTDPFPSTRCRSWGRIGATAATGSPKEEGQELHRDEGKARAASDARRHNGMPEPCAAHGLQRVVPLLQVWAPRQGRA